MKWKKSDFPVYFLCGLCIFIASWGFIHAYISYYELAVVRFCNAQLEVLTNPFVRGTVVTTTLPIVIEFSVPAKLKTFVTLPPYEMAWPLLFALIIPLPFIGWKRKAVHLLLGSLLCAAGIVVHFYAAYFYVALHGPGGFEFLRSIASSALSWFLMFNAYTGTFVLPLVYWFCITDFLNRGRATGDAVSRSKSLTVPLKGLG